MSSSPKKITIPGPYINGQGKGKKETAYTGKSPSIKESHNYESNEHKKHENKDYEEINKEQENYKPRS